ncbi:MAG: plasmid maintenance system killer protein [Candidatus Parabeggiatoa sp. nov. 3]|nr:MAG: plasmid maintenance system killer protein [Gammaproteobacteria bacterium]RKZ85738.1 MAG: plasmid maintenance system killer protein [Gammaproteobacteria bacterium]
MIIDFFDKGTEDVYNGIDSKEARKTLPVKLKRIALRKFYFLDNAINIEDLRKPPSNHLELLQGDRQGQYSIRINNRYRICFVWTEQGPTRVEIVDYH